MVNWERSGMVVGGIIRSGKGMINGNDEIINDNKPSREIK